MYIFHKLLLILLLSLSGALGKNEECVDERIKDSECGSYCYKIVKPLLQYAASVRSKEHQFNDLIATIQIKDATIESLDKQLMLCMPEQKDCLTQEKMMSANQAILDKIQNLEDQLKEWQNKASEISEQKSKEAANVPTEPTTTTTTTTTIAPTVPIAKEIKKPPEKKKEKPSSCIGEQGDEVEIQVPGMNPFYVSCDSSLAGPGWIVIQRRIDGSENFNRNIHEYCAGFGNSNHEFFIGLDKLHLLTSFRQHELYIYLKNMHNEVRYARYGNFRIGGPNEDYMLKTADEYSGNAGDAMDYYRKSRFSTPDYDRDNDPIRNCAKLYKSGWWHNKCHSSNLNGVYRTAQYAHSVGVQWKTWHTTSLQFVQMMIRPVK